MFLFRHHHLQESGNINGITAIKKSANYRSIHNCVTEKQFAAVAWGGHSADPSNISTTWSVILPDRSIRGDPAGYRTCHGSIPPLIPGSTICSISPKQFCQIVSFTCI